MTGRRLQVAWFVAFVAGIAAICGTIWATRREPEVVRYEYHAVQRGSREWLYRTDKVTGQVERVDSIPGLPGL